MASCKSRHCASHRDISNQNSYHGIQDCVVAASHLLCPAPTPTGVQGSVQTLESSLATLLSEVKVGED